MMAPYFRNILITGTPGTGKSTLACKVAERTGMQWINVSEVAIKEGLTEDYDSLYSCPIIDERKVIKYLKPRMKSGGIILDYHGCAFLPRHWFTAVFVPRTSLQLLYSRLESRGYSGKKMDDNIECEIFQLLLDEARETFNADVVHEIVNNDKNDLKNNVEFIVSVINGCNDRDSAK